MKMKLTQRMSQKMVLTPQMRQSIHILQLPILELKDYLQQQIEENPALEETSSTELKDSAHDEKINQLIQQGEKNRGDYENLSNSAYNREEAQKKQDFRESLIVKKPTLQEHLMRQLRMQLMDAADYKIGEFLIGCIDENGYFHGSVDEIEQAAASLGINSTPQKINSILLLIQTFEPAGVGARNLQECLIIQLNAKENQNPLCYKIIKNHLPDLAKNKTKLIAKSLKVTVNQVKEVLKEISRLEPKPGRSFTQIESRRISSRPPDIIVNKIDNRYEIIINTRELPRIRISEHYKRLLSRGDVSEETKKYLKERISAGLWLIKAIAQRQQTIRNIAECIIRIQRDFFEHGEDEKLKPLTLQEVAQLLGRNESTISRVVNNKYIQTSCGTFKLSYFFTNSFMTSQGQAISSETIKSQIIDFIDEENPKVPLSDDKIVKQLSLQGIKIARRTIAKYREKLKIPPARLRKK